MFRKNIIKTSLYMLALTGGYSEYNNENFIEDDNDYFGSQIVNKVGSFGFNSASAKGIEIIEVVGDKVDSGVYYSKLESALWLITRGQGERPCYDPYGIGCTYDTSRRGHEDSVRDRACAEVADSKPEGCVPSQAKNDIKPNGCNDLGVGGGWGDSYFVPSCNSHDQCYADLDSTRSECDRMFHRDMEIQCVQKRPPGTTLALCNQQAGRFKTAVTVIGWAFYGAAQEAAACVVWNEERGQWGCPY